MSHAANEPWISAEAAIVVEATTGKTLYSKNPDTKLVPASMTKVMTCYIIFEEIYAGNLTFDTQVPVTKAHSELESQFYYMDKEKFPAYTTISVDMLLKMILLPSSCAACIIIADYLCGSEDAFVQRMNDTADRLSMDADYENCHGMFSHYLTARAQARLVQVFLQQFPEILEYTSLTEVDYNGYTHKNTNLLLLDGNYTYSAADGFKTGGTIASGYCLCSTAEIDGVRVIVVLMKGLGNASCFGASISLMDYGFERLSEGEPPFWDGEYHPASFELFERYRRENVNLQSVNGWVRPAEPITRGEFALLLVELLELHGLIESVDLAPEGLPTVWDLNNYHGKEQILRGIAYDFFPFGTETFGTNALLTPADMEETFVRTLSALGIVEEEPPVEEEEVPEVELPLIPIRWAVLSSEDSPELVEEDILPEQQSVLRGDALLAMEERFAPYFWGQWESESPEEEELWETFDDEFSPVEDDSVMPVA